MRALDFAHVAGDAVDVRPCLAAGARAPGTVRGGTRELDGGLRWYCVARRCDEPFLKRSHYLASPTVEPKLSTHFQPAIPPTGCPNGPSGFLVDSCERGPAQPRPPQTPHHPAPPLPGSSPSTVALVFKPLAPDRNRRIYYDGMGTDRLRGCTFSGRCELMLPPQRYPSRYRSAR